MTFCLVPARIKITVELGPKTRDIITNILIRLDQSATTQAAVDALAKRLKDSREKLAAALAAHPDPNPND